jgi:hypothetical protein
MAWTVNNNQAAAANVNYSFAFTTATAVAIKGITFTVSATGLAGTPTVVASYGVPAGTVTRSGQTLIYQVTTAINIAAGMPIFIELGALTNPTAGTYTSDIATYNAAATQIDGGATPSVTFGASDTATDPGIGKSLTSTLSATTLINNLDPSVSALNDVTTPVALSVLTNATSGYTLVVKDVATGLQCSCTGTPVIAKVSTGKATSVSWPGPRRWGYTVTATGATADAAFSGAKYAGYTAGGESVATHAGPTGGVADVITITNRVAIDFANSGGTYGDTITYTVTPNYL